MGNDYSRHIDNDKSQVAESIYQNILSIQPKLKERAEQAKNGRKVPKKGQKKANMYLEVSKGFVCCLR